MTAVTTGCSFVASDLVSEYSGQVPTFSYRATSHSDDYFGVQMTFLTGTSTCYGATPSGTPYITNSAAGFSRDCLWNYIASQEYTALVCTASVTDIPDGPLTISYEGVAADAAQSPMPFVATFGPSPTAQVTTTSTTTSILDVIATSTASADPITTVTVTESGSPINGQNTVQVTQPTTSTSTVYVSSCSSSSPAMASSTPSSDPSSSRISSSSGVSSTTLPPTSIALASSTSTSVPPSSTVFCPGSDGSIIQTYAGPIQDECYTDRPNYDTNYDTDYDSDYDTDYDTNHDISGNPLYPGTYEGCLAACAARSDCQQVAYVPGGPCYLESAVGYPNKSGNVIGGRLLANRQVASSVSSKATTSSVSVSRTSAIASPTSYQTTTVTTTVSGTGYQCTCKPTDAPTLVCPSADGTTHTSDCGATYAIECAADRHGNDLAGSILHVDNLSRCIKACDNTPGCVGVSYSPGFPPSCYLKGAVGALSVNSNIWGARQLTSCSTTGKLKLHRKRVVHAVPVKKAIEKRGIPYGPDYTYITGTSTVVSTSTSTSTTATTTVTPTESGATTITVYTTAYVTAVVTSAVPSTTVTSVTVTTCPAMSAPELKL
ncbi:hypothetical protein EK21DRAFT_88595 [Setomelanomma holmii]|uniref:Apple domain-containing protein n=1 Tax=Setomelanomma holmii TaxID=210430 RepID=A0A9P4HA43_9PLEO|nr:hypothetical protein EK21DRAFT_88595 [Setomelanomma holmii]